MQAHGWQAVAVEAEGRQALQVSGFKDEGQLAALLITQQFAKGTPQIEEEPGDHPTRSTKEWLEDNSIKAGGVLNLLGDGALLMSGIMSGRTNEAYAGALYTGGALVSARYGNVKTAYHVRQVTENVAEYLKQQAGELPEDCGLYSILQDKREGRLNKIEDFLYRYPSQTTLGAYTLGAFSMLESGLRHGKGWDVAYGVSSITTKAASLMIPEKSADQLTEEEKAAHAKHGPVGKLFDWIQEKPLRIFGYGSMVTDTLLGLSALREYRTNPRQKSYVFKFITTGTYLMADMMYAISSKNAGGKFDAEEQRQIVAMAAESIAAQPRAMREGLANQVAGYLSTQPEINGTAPEISHAILHQAEEMRANPWACRVARLPQGVNPTEMSV